MASGSGKISSIALTADERTDFIGVVASQASIQIRETQPGSSHAGIR